MWRIALLAACFAVQLPAHAASPLRCDDGYAALRLTINPQGLVKDVQVLDEAPRWCGLGEQAKVAAQRLMFEPSTTGSDDRGDYVLRVAHDPVSVSGSVFSVASLR